MFGLTTRGQLDPITQLEFERFYARLSEFLGVSFNEDGTLSTTVPDTREIGEVVDFAGPTAPDKWLLCDGSLVSRVTYKRLFEVIGTTYGAGDGSTTFKLPDVRGRFTICVSASGTASVLGETGGSINHTHAFSGVSVSGTTSANGAHTHSASTSSDGAHTHSQGAHSHAVGAGSPNVAASGSDYAIYPSTQTDIFNDSGTGSAGSHTHSVTVNNVGDHTHTFSASGSGTVDSANPPYIAFNKIIYTGVSA